MSQGAAFSNARGEGLAASEPKRKTAHVFVGRERELCELSAGLEEAMAGRGSLFLLSGEPGIGKTRLAQEFGDLAGRRGLRVLWGRAWEGGGQPAYWPWVQILRECVRSEDLPVLAKRLGSGAAYLAQLVPELEAFASGEPETAKLDSESDRFYFFAAASELLCNAAAQQPLLLILDDLHAADRPSLLLLQFLAAELHQNRILAIGTHRRWGDRSLREAHALLADLVRSNRHIPLGGLSERETALLIEGCIGRAPTAELVSEIHRVTGGNPYFADEFVRLLVAEGRLEFREPLAGAFKLPSGVSEAIRRRLAPLPETCRELLAVAAVAGQEFETRLLEHLAGRPLGQVRRALDDASAAGILEPVPSRLGRFCFCSALIRDVLYEDIPSARRQTLHREVGESIEKLYSSGPERLAELAHHFSRAASDVLARKAVDYAASAGRRAMEQLAYEEAAGHFDLALQASALLAEFGALQHCELLLALGAAHGAAGDRTRAQVAFVDAAQAARAAGDAEALAAAALGLGRQSAFDDLFEARKLDGRLAPLLEEALGRLPDEDSSLRASLLSRLATALFWKPGRKRVQSLIREAVAMAERLSDSHALTEALAHKRIVLFGPGDVEERLADATRVIDLAAQTGNRQREFHAREARLRDLLELGDITAADVEVEWIEQLARELQQPRYLADVKIIRSMRVALDGELDKSEELARRWLALNKQVRPAMALTLYGSQMFRTVWMEKGRLAELEAGIEALIEREGPLRALSSALAYVRSEQGNTEQTRAAFERLAAKDFADVPRELGWMPAMANLTEVCCFLEDLPRARILYRELLPFAHLNVVIGALPLACWGPVAHFLGMLAAKLENEADAVRHFEFALQMESAMRMPTARARTHYEYARMLVRSDCPDARVKGADLLVLAMAAARRFGMNALEGRVSALLAELSQPTADVPDELAERVGECSPNLFRREGEYWTIVYEGRALRLRDTKGLAYLAELLRAPERDCFALDLVRLQERRIAGEPQTIEEAMAVERARQSVTVAIRLALKKITASHPDLGLHLTSTVRTGKFCRYAPGSGAPSWYV